MGDSGARSHDQRELSLRYPARCATCSASLPANSRAVWNSSTKTARCLPCAVPVQAPPPPTEVGPVAPVDFGIAGASAQRLFNAKEARRRARLHANWWAVLTVAVIGAIVGGYLGQRLHSSPAIWAAVGAAIPVVNLLRRPQHIDACAWAPQANALSVGCSTAFVLTGSSPFTTVASQADRPTSTTSPCRLRVSSSSTRRTLLGR